MFTIIVSLFLACSDKSEDITCDVNGEIYAVGESYDAADGCNTCTCMADGEGGASVGCTEMGCAEPEPTGCSDMSIETCEETPTCTVVYGSPLMLDTDNECYAWANEVTALGCMDADAMCTEMDIETGKTKHTFIGGYKKEHRVMRWRFYLIISCIAIPI